MWKECVIDAEMGCRDGLFCFCPIDGDINGYFSVVTGTNFLGSAPPENMKLVAIVHPDGQKAVEEFCQKYERELALACPAAAEISYPKCSHCDYSGPDVSRVGDISGSDESDYWCDGCWFADYSGE